MLRRSFDRGVKDRQLQFIPGSLRRSSYTPPYLGVRLHHLGNSWEFWVITHPNTDSVRPHPTQSSE